MIIPGIILALSVTAIAAASWVWQRNKLVSRLRKERDEIENEEHRMFDFLHGLGQALSQESAPQATSLHRIIVRGVSMVLDARGGALYLLDKRQKRLLPKYQSPSCPPLIPLPPELDQFEEKAVRSHMRLTSVPRTDGILGEALSQNSVLYLEPEQIRQHLNGNLKKPGHLLLAPLRYGDKELGVLAISNDSATKPFSHNDCEMFRSVAEQSAFALGTAILHQDADQKRILEQELRTAREVQRILLPDHPPELKSYQIIAANRPARLVSGDYFDYIPIDDSHLGVVIADVSGKGIGASLITAMCRSVIRDHALANHSPKSVLAAANRVIFPDIRDDMFISLAYFIFETDSSKITMARAGHDSPFLFTKKSGQVRSLTPKGCAVGIDSGVVFERVIEDFSFEMDPGDILLLYTDGINEAADVEGEEYGIERFRAVFGENAPHGAQIVVDSILKDVASFTKGNAQSDDITLIAIEKR